MRRRILYTLTTMFVIALYACSGGRLDQSDPVEEAQEQAGGEDSNSGDDVALAGARGLFDIVVNDNVDAVEGDNTDYKYFDIDERGRVDIRVRFMSSDVAGSVSIHNDFGEIIHEESVAMGQSEVNIRSFSVLPGRYYVRVYASEGESDYAIGRDFEPSRRTASRDDDDDDYARVSRDDDDDDDRSSRRRSSRDDDDDDDDRSSRRRSSRDDDDDDEEEEEEEEEEEVVEEVVATEPEPEEEEAEPISATILTIRERSGGATLVLLGCGSSSGLSAGDRGRIGSTGARATISRITGSDSCEAETDASPGSIGRARNVSFSP